MSDYFKEHPLCSCVVLVVLVLVLVGYKLSIVHNCCHHFAQSCFHHWLVEERLYHVCIQVNLFSLFKFPVPVTFLDVVLVALKYHIEN